MLTAQAEWDPMAKGKHLSKYHGTQAGTGQWGPGLRVTGKIPPAAPTHPGPRPSRPRVPVDQSAEAYKGPGPGVKILCGPFAVFSVSPCLPIPGHCFVNSWPWSWGWTGEG